MPTLRWEECRSDRGSTTLPGFCALLCVYEGSTQMCLSPNSTTDATRGPRLTPRLDHQMRHLLQPLPLAVAALQQAPFFISASSSHDTPSRPYNILMPPTLASPTPKCGLLASYSSHCYLIHYLMKDSHHQSGNMRTLSSSRLATSLCGIRHNRLGLDSESTRFSRYPPLSATWSPVFRDREQHADTPLLPSQIPQWDTFSFVLGMRTAFVTSGRRKAGRET